MPREEFRDRYNKCIDANNRVIREVDFAAEIKASWTVPLDRIRRILGLPTKP